MSIQLSFCSSLAKILPLRAPEWPVEKGSALRGERFSFQLAFTSDSERGFLEIRTSCGLPLRKRMVAMAPVLYTGFEHDDDIVSAEPGLYPDLLTDFDEGGRHAVLIAGQWRSVWFTVDVPSDCPAGVYPIDVEVTYISYLGEREVRNMTFSLEVIGAALPPQSLIYTSWMHTDCLASYYGFDVFSEEYWRTVANFVKNAAAHGVNMLLTPLVTPPLDTEVGAERPTVQLVQVGLDGDGYAFDFSLLERWVDMGRECGMEYFEIPPLFTQWGAMAAPKVMAMKDGELVRIFGWDTPAASNEYRRFLTEMLTALRKWIEGRGLHEAFYFHCSDEPYVEHLENYKECQKFLQGLLDGFPIIDAMGCVDYYRQGIVQNPVPSERVLDDFIEAGMRRRWTYYCCNPLTEYSNRFINMTSSRNRIFGSLLYLYKVEGFLHWGFNFYYTVLSRSLIDPYRSTDAGGNYPAGDPFLVYPGKGGVPEDSIRHEVFYEALQDMRALQLLETLSSRGEVEKLLDAAGVKKMNAYPKGEKAVLALRAAVNDRIRNFSK